MRNARYGARYFLLLFGGGLAALACRGSEPTRAGTRATDSIVKASTPSESTIKPLLIEHDSVTLHAPPWTVASAIAALQAARLNPAPVGGTVRYHGVAVPGTRVRIDGGEVQLFIYGDANVAGVAADTLARIPVGVLQRARATPASAGRADAARRSMSSQPDSSILPLVLSTDNLLAIVFAQNRQVEQRVHDALERKHTP